MPPTQAYTSEEVLRVLSSMCPFADAYTCDEFADLPLIDFGEWPLEFNLQRSFMKFFSRLEDAFGFTASPDEWRPLAKKDTTMQQLADFISERAVRLEVRSRALLGKVCLSAGIFETLAQATGEVLGSNAHIAPSTPIRSVMTRTQRERFATRLATVFPRLYQATDLWCEAPILAYVFSVSLAVCALCTVLGCLVIIPLSLPILGCLQIVGAMLAVVALYALIAVLATGPAAAIASFVRGRSGPFRKDVRTYRDLVMVLKDHWRRWGLGNVGAPTSDPREGGCSYS